MKRIKLYEDFVDDIMKGSDPSKPIERMDLTGKPYDKKVGYGTLPLIDVKYALEFVPAGTFSSIGNARKYLEEMGYIIGSMQGPSPIGFADGSRYDYVSKWDNMNRSEHGTLDGVIIPDPEFREGGSIILFFQDPKF